MGHRLAFHFCLFAVALTGLTLFFDASSPERVIVGGVVFAALMTAATWALTWLLARRHDRSV
jgi:threonine/homoserine efflux transporter RhtA